MRPRIAQRALMGVAVLGALLFATGCNNPIDPPAATVGDIDISRGDLFREARQLASIDNDRLGIIADTNNALDGEMVANVLSGQIAAAIYESEAERMGLEVDDAAINAARSELESSADAASYPDELVDVYARRTATRRAVDEHITTQQWWTDVEIEKFHKLTSERVCVSHILLTSEDEAEAVLDQLRDGADFAELAAESSADQSSAADGGNVGCRPRNTLFRAFNAAIDAEIDVADSGDLLGPLTSQTGVHVVRVDEAFHRVPLDEAREEIESSFADPQGAGWAQFVLKTTKVTVDPRFGSWDSAVGRVVPPEGARAASSAGAFTVS